MTKQKGVYECGFCGQEFRLSSESVDASLGPISAVFCSKDCYINRLEQIVKEYREPIDGSAK